MRLHVWGSDFRRSDAEFRAKLLLGSSRKEKKTALLELGFRDLVYLSTCNRVEFYTSASDPFEDLTVRWQKLLEVLGLTRSDFYRGYCFEGKSAVRHLMRVSASLESMVVGEPQILGQIKAALQESIDDGIALDRETRRCFELALSCAKRIRSETEIGQGNVSVTSHAMNQIRGRCSRVVIVGRGPTSLSALRAVASLEGVSEILWVNRTVEALNDETLDRLEISIAARARIQRMSLSQFLTSPPDFDCLVTATASTEPMFSGSFFEKLRTPLQSPRRILVDLAQPPDIDRHATLPLGTQLIGLEELEKLTVESEQSRLLSIHQADSLVESMLREYCLSRKTAPLLSEFSKVEASLVESARVFATSLEGELSSGLQTGALAKSLESLSRKQLHLSKEHLKESLIRLGQDSPEVTVG